MGFTDQAKPIDLSGIPLAPAPTDAPPAPPPDPNAPPEPLRSRPTRSAAVLATSVALPPVAISFVSLPGRKWVPAGDESVISYHVRQLASGHIPLVGVYSTHGWAHPGPALYFLLAPA